MVESSLPLPPELEGNRGHHNRRTMLPSSGAPDDVVADWRLVDHGKEPAVAHPGELSEHHAAEGHHAAETVRAKPLSDFVPQSVRGEFNGALWRVMATPSIRRVYDGAKKVTKVENLIPHEDEDGGVFFNYYVDQYKHLYADLGRGGTEDPGLVRIGAYGVGLGNEVLYLFDGDGHCTLDPNLAVAVFFGNSSGSHLYFEFSKGNAKKPN